MRGCLSSLQGLHTAGVRHALLLNGFIDLLNGGRGQARKGCIHFQNAVRKHTACRDLSPQTEGSAAAPGTFGLSILGCGALSFVSQGG